jgi:CYTH domain-containing protein
MKLRTGRVIEKWRYVVKVGKARFEVDVFKHRGLMIAEIELPTGAGSFRTDGMVGKRSDGGEALL